MNKFLRYSFVALLAFFTGISAWADESVLTFSAACGGKGTAADGVEWTVASDGDESNFDNAKGIHYGTGSKAVQYIKLSTSGISGTITSVVVNASTANNVTASVDVTVGGTAFGGEAQAISSSAADYTFEGSASGEIVVTVTKPESAVKALYVKSIKVTYTPAAGAVSAPLFSVPSGFYFEAQNVELSCTTEGATIYYNIDSDEDPTAASTKYTAAIPVAKSAKIKAIAIGENGNKSGVVSADYTIVITDNKGTVESPFTVADGLKVIDALADGATSPEIYIQGYVIGEITIGNNQATFQIGATADATEGLLTVYRAKGLENGNYTEGMAKAGDLVVICAPLQRYVKGEVLTPETQYGYIYSVNGKTKEEEPDPEPLTEIAFKDGKVESNFTDNNLTVGEGELAWEASIAAFSFDSQSERGVQFGAGKGEFTLTSKQTVKGAKTVKLLVSTNGTGNTIGVKVGDTAFGETIEMTRDNNYELLFVSETGADGQIVISVNDASKSVYVKQITVYDTVIKAAVKGDINGDGEVNGMDIQEVINACVDELKDAKYDVNGDSEVNGMDIQEVINIAAEAEARRL